MSTEVSGTKLAQDVPVPQNGDLESFVILALAPCAGD